MEKELKKLIEKWRKYLTDINPWLLTTKQDGMMIGKSECANELEEFLKQWVSSKT